MNDFHTDDQWQREVKRRLLYPLYERMLRSGWFGSWRESIGRQEERRGDTVICDGLSSTTIEEKIVRWKGREYTAIPIETMSCTIPGLEKRGWIVNGEYDWLMHVRVMDGEDSASCDIFDFSDLRLWFATSGSDRWPKHTETKNNKTECRIVSLAEIRANVTGRKFTLPDGDFCGLDIFRRIGT